MPAAAKVAVVSPMMATVVVTTVVMVTSTVAMIGAAACGNRAKVAAFRERQRT